MKKYIIGRVIKSIISVFIVISIVIVMLFTLIPKTNIFKNDTSIQKMKGDARTTYMYSKWDELGYLDYVSFNEMCTNEADDYSACVALKADEVEKVIARYEANNYKIEKLSSGQVFAYHEFNVLELLGHFYGKVLQIDHPNKIKDESNPELERKYYVGNDYNGLPAIMCS